MNAVLSVALPVFAIIAVGLVAGRFKLMSASDSQALNKFVFRFAMPAALFGLTAGTAPPGATDLTIAISYGAAAFVAVFGGYFLSQTIFPITKQEAGAHAKSQYYNEHGIGICLVGNFELSPPTPAQMAALRTLLGALERRYGIPRDKVLGHHEVREGGGTVCPGRFFPMDELRGAGSR